MVDPGRALMRGLRLGIRNGAYMYVYPVAQDIIDGYVAEIQTALDTISGIITGTVTIQPTISPVLDLSNIRANAGELQTLLSGKPIIFNQNIDFPEIKVKGQNEILAAVNSVNERIDALNANLANLKVVMNSGALVGAIGPEMDMWLGARAQNYNRWR